ncbi:helix-turn-helix domain-containing protein [Paenibacillus tarimensis]
MFELRLRENTVHGDSSFPFSVYRVDYPSGNRPILPCHWHEELEIIHVVRGSAQFKIDDFSFDLQEGESLLVGSGQLHSGFSFFGEGCGYMAIVFHLNILYSQSSDACQESFVEPLQNGLFQLPVRFQHQAQKENQLTTLILRMVEAYETKWPGYQLAIKGCLYLLFSMLLQNRMLLRQSSASPPLFQKKQIQIKNVLQYIEEHYSRDIYIDELASLLSLSRSHFCRVFKDFTGFTPMDYLNLYRVNKAADLLKTEGCMVIDAALQTGFDNLSHFTNTFKKYMQCTPSAYKRDYDVKG